jgi:phospholipid-binding lipoprotein MlaA
VRRALPLAFVALFAAGCLMPPPGPDGTVDPDPYEAQNRVIFAFNDGLDRLALEPLSRLWRFVTPQILRTGLDNVFTNLRFPVRAVSCLGQGRPKDAGEETVRFLVNSTLGVAGVWDPSTKLFHWPFFDEDTGQMLAVWGLPSGPFWMIPLLGASTPRDTVGYIVDSFLNLTPSYGAPVAWLNGRAIAIPTVDRAREASLDYYLFVRDAYLQRREAQIEEKGPRQRLEGEDERAPSGPGDEFYEVPADQPAADAGPGE